MSDLEFNLIQQRNDHTRDLLRREGDILHADQLGIELVPQRHHILVALYLLLQLKFQFTHLILGALHLDTEGTLLALDRRQGALTHLQLLLQLLKRCLVILKLNSHV